MAIKNKRQTVKKSTDKKLNAKLKESFEWLDENDDELADEVGEELDFSDLDTDDADEITDEVEIDETAEETQLTQSQEELLDDEVDALLQSSLDGATESEDLLEDEDSELDSELDFEDSTDELDFDDSEVDDKQITDLLTAEDIQDIIDSPNSLEALETELTDKILNTDETTEEVETDDILEENEDPFAGIEDIFTQGYEGEDIEDELQESKKPIKEDAELADSLEDADFVELSDVLNDDFDNELSDIGVRGGADSNEEDAKIIAESIKKSKMLVQSAAVILKLKEMNKAEKNKISKVMFENEKLKRANALLVVAGEKMSTEVKKALVESFTKCKNKKELEAIYSKVVNVIKENNKPSLNKIKQEPKVKSVQKTINESQNRGEVKVGLTAEQKRKAYLMGIKGYEDYYYNY